MELIIILIVMAVIILAMVAAFLFIIISLLKQHTANNDQFMYANFEWADKYHKTVNYYEDELQSVYDEVYGDEEEHKN